MQSKKVDQREHCMKAKYKTHKYNKSQRGQCSKAGGHLVCWRPPQVARSLKSEVRPQLGIWHSDIGTLAAGTLGTACGQVMHTLWFRVKVLNCFYSWLCRYSVEIFVSKSISLNIEIFIRHACTFSHWTDIDGHLSQKKQKYQAVAKIWNRREWINKNGKHLRHLPLGVGPLTPLMILNSF